MDVTPIISRLFAWVLHNEMEKDNVSIEDVIEGIKHMNDAYKHKHSSLSSENAVCANYETAAFRCAYLHKYATLHAALVSDVTFRLLQLNYNTFHDILTNHGCLNLCSLGGGPASDIVGMMLALNFTYGLFQVSSTIIDCMPSWNATVKSMIKETQSGTHGQLRDIFSKQYFQLKYFGSNLLEEFSDEVMTVISSADIINMIKFVSAAACVDTENMIKRVFELMKPGAIAFFIDNSIGNIKFIVTRVATECNMESLLGPISHEHYINLLTEMFRFGYSSCYQTKIAIQVWRKPQTLLRYIEDKKPYSYLEKVSSSHMQSTPILCKRKALLSPQSSPNSSYGTPHRIHFKDDSFFEDSFCSSSPSNHFQISSPSLDNSYFSYTREDNFNKMSPWLPINNQQMSNLRYSTNSLHNLEQSGYFENSFDNNSHSVTHSLINLSEFSDSITSTPFAARPNSDSGYSSPHSPYFNRNTLENHSWNDNKFSYQSSNQSPDFNHVFPGVQSHSWNTTFNYNSGCDQINNLNFNSSFKNFQPFAQQHTFNKMRGKFHSNKDKGKFYSTHNKENFNIAHSFERNCNRNQRYQPYMNNHRFSNYATKDNKISSQLFCGRLF